MKMFGLGSRKKILCDKLQVTSFFEEFNLIFFSGKSLCMQNRAFFRKNSCIDLVSEFLIGLRVLLTPHGVVQNLMSNPNLSIIVSFLPTRQLSFFATGQIFNIIDLSSDVSKYKSLNHLKFKIQSSSS